MELHKERARKEKFGFQGMRMVWNGGRGEEREEKDETSRIDKVIS